jgi:carbon storage regulator
METQLSGLVLTRKPGEAVKIAQGITVTVVQVKGEQVRLKFSAPPEIVIDREEIYLKKLTEPTGS